MSFGVRARSPFGLILVLFLGQVLVGCSHFQATSHEKQFVFEKSWARHTIEGDYYLGARVNHTQEPVLYKELVIQGNELDSLSAYDKTTGRLRWKKRISGGVASSAKLADGVLYFGGGDGFFYAVQAANGVTKWSFPIRSEGIGAPLVANDAVYFLAGNSAAYAVRASTGEQIWFYNRPDPADITVRGASEPSLYGKNLYLGFSDGALVVLDKDKGTVVWEKPLSTNARFKDVDAKPVIDGERVYISSYDGQLYCLNALNGQTLWVSDEGGFTPVTIFENTIYYSTSTRKLMALDKVSGKQLWSVDLKKTVASQPVVYRGLVLASEWSGSLKAFDQLTGRLVTAFDTGRGVTSRPALDPARDAVYVMSVDANLFALRLKLKNQKSTLPWEIE
jgi:outer membrane protein assembly factor BamB